MKKLGIIAILSLLSGCFMISTASAQVPRKCMDGYGNVLCQKRGCESYCRPAMPLPPPPPPAPMPPHHANKHHGHYQGPMAAPHNDRMALDRQIDELERDNRHYRKQLRDTFNPYERRHLEAAIERNEREIDRLKQERRYYR